MAGRIVTIAQQKGDIGGALNNLSHQLDRADAVAVPAARALGLAGTAAELPSLAAALSGGGSTELKTTAADAIGNILARLAGCPDDVAAALIAVVEGDGDVAVRTAAAVALGKGKIDAGQRAELSKKLRRVAGTAGSEG